MSDHTRVVAVTGAATGLGAAASRLLEADGARVIGVALEGTEVTADLGTAEGRASAIAAIRAAAPAGLDGLALCAGLGPQHADAAEIASVNYFGVVELLDALASDLARGQEAAAVCISSIAATATAGVDMKLVEAMLAGDEPAARTRASASPGSSAVYGASKLAVARAMRMRVTAWGEAGVRCNAVAPGSFLSPMMAAILRDPVLEGLTNAMPIPLQRMAEPVEIAQAVVFLLSPAASYVHGTVFHVDGGADALMRPDSL